MVLKSFSYIESNYTVVTGWHSTMPKEKKIKYSAELTKLLEFLKNNNPTHLQKIKSKELNQEERGIYLDAMKKKGMADRKKRFKRFDKGIHKKI